MNCPKCGSEMPDNPHDRCNSCARWGAEATIADIAGIMIERGSSPKAMSRILRREECSLPITDDGSGREHGLCNPYKDARYWVCKCGHEVKVKS